MMPTQLTWRTPAGGVTLPAGQSIKLVLIDVSSYSRIRVVAVEHADVPGRVKIRLMITEGAEVVAELGTLDTASLATQVYDVPGVKLTLFADTIGLAGPSVVDVLIYGA